MWTYSGKATLVPGQKTVWFRYICHFKRLFLCVQPSRGSTLLSGLNFSHLPLSERAPVSLFKPRWKSIQFATFLPFLLLQFPVPFVFLSLPVSSLSPFFTFEPSHLLCLFLSLLFPFSFYPQKSCVCLIIGRRDLFFFLLLQWWIVGVRSKTNPVVFWLPRRAVQLAGIPAAWW